MNLRTELYAVVDRIVESIEKAPRGDDWIDQHHSPLGRQKHIRLVKSGALPGSREGKQYLVRRSDIDAYLAKMKVTPIVSEVVESDDAIAERLNAEIRRSR